MPLKWGEVNCIFQGHRNVKVDSTLNSFTPKPPSTISCESTGFSARITFSSLFIHLYLGYDLEKKCQLRLTGGKRKKKKKKDSSSQMHCIPVATFTHKIISSLRKLHMKAPGILPGRISAIFCLFLSGILINISLHSRTAQQELLPKQHRKKSPRWEG